MAVMDFRNILNELNQKATSKKFLKFENNKVWDSVRNEGVVEGKMINEPV